MVAASKRAGGRTGGAAARGTAQAAGGKQKGGARQDGASSGPWANSHVETTAERFARGRRARSPDRRTRSDAFSGTRYRGQVVTAGTDTAAVARAAAESGICRALEKIGIRA